jgi:hypothetical protein
MLQYFDECMKDKTQTIVATEKRFVAEKGKNVVLGFRAGLPDASIF